MCTKYMFDPPYFIGIKKSRNVCLLRLCKKKSYFETMNKDNTPPVVLSEENKNKNGNNVTKKNDTDIECGEVKLELQQQRQKKGGVKTAALLV